MNLCTSAQESWITRLWEKLNKIEVWINCVRSRECKIWRFRPSDFQIKKRKKSVKRGVRVLRAWSARALHARRACEAREKSVSPQSGSLFSASFQTFCLTSRGCLNKQKYGLFCSLVIKSLRESWIWKKSLVGIMNHWGKNDRNHEYQDSNDSASSPRTYNFGKLTWDLKKFAVRRCV